MHVKIIKSYIFKSNHVISVNYNTQGNLKLLGASLTWNTAAQIK